MQGSSAIMLSLLLVSSALATKESPLSAVVSLLDSLSAKIVADGEKEAKAYKEYFEWCDDASTQKGFDIKTASSAKEALEAAIAKSSATIGTASDKIEELAASIAADSAELKDATAVREKEAADFAASEGELLDVIDTLSRAISIVEKQMAKNPSAFMQLDTSNLDNLVKSLGAIVDAASFPSADKKKLVALVQSQSQDGDDETGAPAAAVYKTSSTGVVDVLEDLKEKAEEQLSSLRKAEGSASHNYAMLKQSLEDEMAAETKAMEEAKATKAAAEEAKATAEGDLTATKKTLADGEAALETLHTECMRTAADHEATVTGRTEELAVLAKAKSILESSTGGAAAQTYSMLQLASQLQTRTDLAKTEVITIVKKLAKAQGSAALAQLASRIAAVMQYGAAAGEDPFAKVKSLITGLISKLESEAASSASEKAYCDEQMSKTEAKKGEIEDDLSKLSTKIDTASADSATLKGEVKTLQAELAALAKSQAEMDSIRAEAHSDYTAAKADLEAGLAGVRKALGVLRDYYGSSAAAMVQESSEQPAAPELHEKATGAGTSIIGILEVVESDFAKNLADVEAAEADEESSYEKTTQENAVTKTLKDQAVKYKTQEYKALDAALADLTADLDTKTTEQTAVLEYYSKIKDRCIAKAETYEERAAKRQAEIAGLKQALDVLENEVAFTQRRKRGNNRGHFLGL